MACYVTGTIVYSTKNARDSVKTAVDTAVANATNITAEAVGSLPAGTGMPTTTQLTISYSFDTDIDSATAFLNALTTAIAGQTRSTTQLALSRIR
jgi:hypothetical protein